MPCCRNMYCLLMMFVTGSAFAAAPIDSPFQFRSRETVVFFGDSITFDGLYTEYTEALLRSRHPEVEWHFSNAANLGTTLADVGANATKLSAKKPGDRFTTEVVAKNPTLIIACFGMFEGGFASFSETRFASFRDGINRLIQRTRAETKARLILLTPPLFDDLDAGKPDQRPAESYTSRAPFKGYDTVLETYSNWMLGSLQNLNDVSVFDLHSAMLTHLQRRRRSDAKYTLQPDHVRPNATGHMVIASTLAWYLGLPATADACEIDAANMKPVLGKVARLRKTDAGLAFEWAAKIFTPQDGRWNAESLAMENLITERNRCELKVTGLPSGEYEVKADGRVVAFSNSQELAAGLDLLQLKAFPTHVRSSELLTFLEERRKLDQKLKTRSNLATKERESELKRADAIDERVKQLSTPTPIPILVVRQK